MKSRDPYVAHIISPSIMLTFKPSKVPSLIRSETGLVMPSHSLEPIMSSSSSTSDIQLLSNSYFHVLKGDIGACTSDMP